VRRSAGAADRLGYNAAVMRARIVLSMVGIGIVVSSCASDEREWMKIDQKYTTAEFRRDLAECTVKGKLDEECMKTRGWVTVAPPKAEQKKDDPLSQPYGRTGPRR
jgi:hypothetical protein